MMIERGEEVPAGGSEGASERGVSMGALKDSTILLTSEGDKAQETVTGSSHLIEAKDRFSELGTPLISRCLAFQGPNIDPYL